MAASLAGGDAVTVGMVSAPVQGKCCGCEDGVAMAAVVAAVDPESVEEYGIPWVILGADSTMMPASYCMKTCVCVSKVFREISEINLS